MELDRQDDAKAAGTGSPRRGAASYIALMLLGLLAGLVALASLAFLVRSTARIFEPTAAPTILTLGGASATMVLLGLILLILFGVFVLLLALLLCVCGCGRNGGLLRLLGLFLPGVVFSLRQASRGLKDASGIAGAAVEPLHDVGAQLRNAGASLAVLRVPDVTAETAETELFWTALRRALKDSPAQIDIGSSPPDGFPPFRVLTSFRPGSRAPFAGDDGVASVVSIAGEQTYFAGDRARNLENDLAQTAQALNNIANSLDALQMQQPPTG